MGMFEGSTDFKKEIIKEGKYTAVPYLIVDCGSREDTYNGETRVKHEVYFAWELVDTKMADGRPFALGNHYSITDGNYGPYFAKTSNMNKLLRGWLGIDEKAASKPALIGKLIREQTPCTITVGEQQGKKDPTKTYNIIEKVAPYKGKDKPQRVNEALMYGPPGSPFPENMPEWLKKRVEACMELNGGVPEKKAPGHAMEEGDMDVPF